MNSFFKGPSSDSFYLLLVKLITIVLSMTVSRILSGTLTFHQYGTYSQVMLLGSTVVAVTIAGMIDGANFFFYNNKGLAERQEYLSTMISLQCIIGFMVTAVLLAVRGAVCSYFSNPQLEWLLLFSAFLSLTQNIISILQVLFIAVGKAKLIAARNLVIAVARLIFFTVACRIYRSVIGVLLVSLVLNLLQILYFHYGLKKNGCLISFRYLNFRLVRSIFSYCIPMAAFVMLSTLARDCDRYVISAFTDTDTLAVYTNASKMLPFDLITVSFCTVLVPYLTRYISQQDFGQASSLYRLFLELCISCTAILAVSALVGAPMLMELLYSSKYMSGLLIFRIYILVDIFRTLNITLILSAAGKGRVLLRVSFVSLLANVLLNVLLYYALGLAGPAVSTLAVTVITGAVIQKQCAQILKIRFSQLFDWKYVGTLGVELVALGIVFHGLSQWLAATRLHYFVRLLAVSGGFFLILTILNGKRILGCIKRIGSYS